MKLSLNINRKKITVLFFCYGLLFSAYPYAFCQFLPIPNFQFLYLAAILLLLIYFVFKKNVTYFPKFFWIICFVQFYFWLFLCFYHQDTSYFTRIVFSILSVLILQFVAIQIGLIDFIKFNNKWLAIMSVGGAVTFFLVMLLGLTPLFTYVNQDGRDAYCFGLTCTNVYWGNVIRYSGFFDEPGAIANWGMFALLYNKIFINNRWVERALLICLPFTLSMAFFIQVIFYFLFFYGRDIKKLFLILFILISTGTIVLPLIETTNKDLYKLTLARFEYDESGGIKGNSRADLTEKAKAQFLRKPILGVGVKKLESIDYMSDNPYEVLAKDGILGMLIMYLPILIIAYNKRKDKNILSVLIILSMGYLQRPYHIDLLHPTMLYFFLIMVLQDKYNSKPIFYECE